MLKGGLGGCGVARGWCGVAGLVVVGMLVWVRVAVGRVGVAVGWIGSCCGVEWDCCGVDWDCCGVGGVSCGTGAGAGPQPPHQSLQLVSW